MQCQYPFLRPNFENTLAFDSSGRMSSITGIECSACFSAVFRICGSMHKRMSPDFLHANWHATDPVCWLSTFAMIFCCSISLSLCSNFVFMLLGTRDDVTAVGMMDSSSVRCTHPDIMPSLSPKNMVKVNFVFAHRTDVVIIDLYYSHLLRCSLFQDRS